MPVLKFKNKETGEWIEVSGGGGGVSIPISDQPPEDSKFWIDTSEGGEGGAVDAYTKEETDALIDEAIAAIPTPDVSGQIGTHNTDTGAHADIRKAATDAEANAKTYTDQKIAAIPTPDVSGQIGAHNTATDAHSDIRKAATDAAGAASTAQSTADTHIANKSNPHGVTAAQVGALPITGGLLTGNLSGQYLSGTWLQATANNAMVDGSKYGRICVLDTNGWIYSRTKAEMLGDIGAASKEDVASKANSTHSHEISDVTNLQTTLDGKAASSHNHDAGNITSGVLPVARGGTGATSISALTTSLGAARIAYGSYRGTGQDYTNDKYKRTLTFDFTPQILIIWDKQSHGYSGAGRNFNIIDGRVDNDYFTSSAWSNQFGIFTPITNKDSSSNTTYQWSVANNTLYITFGTNSITWYVTGNSESDMYNEYSRTYGYIVLG